MEGELTHMVDQVTTNKTDFFREPSHFDYLSQKALPDLALSKRNLVVWSAGCSTGEEPYTLAMVLGEFAGGRHGCDFLILATDISTRVLEKARLAIYDEEAIAPIPAGLKKKYLLRSRDETHSRYRVIPELRDHVRFRQLNLMEGDFGFREQMDIIFCRNVIIYFDKATQASLLTGSAGTSHLGGISSWATRRRFSAWTCRWRRWRPPYTGGLGEGVPQTG